MPSYHIWIRKEDEAKWQAIVDKPEWLHEHLGMISTNTKNNGVLTEAFLQEQFDKAADYFDKELEGLDKIVDDGTATAEYGSISPASKSLAEMMDEPTITDFEDSA